MSTAARGLGEVSSFILRGPPRVFSGLRSGSLPTTDGLWLNWMHRRAAGEPRSRLAAMRSEVESTSDGDRARGRARLAVDALRARHLRRLWHLPGTRLGVSSWPTIGRPLSTARLTASWNYWWQAHLLDTLVDAARLGDERAAGEAAMLARGIHLRNLGHWTNEYYDDMAWLALALERAQRHLGQDHHRALGTFERVLYRAWAPDLGGGIPWRTTDLFFNVPANGPAGIFCARTGRIGRALAAETWIYDEFTLPSGLLADGFWREPDGARRRVDTAYTYCQGVALGLSLETYRHTRAPVHLDRIDGLLSAVAERLTVDGVLIGHGGGDGGLFTAILARNLALIATDLPAGAPGGEELRVRSAGLVLAAARAAWAGRATVDGLPLFSADWGRPAAVPPATGAAARFTGGAVHSSAAPERDLSTQIGGAMLMTAAAAVTLGSPEHAAAPRST